MHYQLRAAEGSREKVADADLPDHFTAENWARDWVRANATQGSYVLQGADGGFARSLFKTHSGQWYLTPAAMEPSGA